MGRGGSMLKIIFEIRLKIVIVAPTKKILPIDVLMHSLNIFALFVFIIVCGFLFSNDDFLQKNNALVSAPKSEET